MCKTDFKSISFILSVTILTQWFVTGIKPYAVVVELYFSCEFTYICGIKLKRLWYALENKLWHTNIKCCFINIVYVQWNILKYSIYTSLIFNKQLIMFKINKQVVFYLDFTRSEDPNLVVLRTPRSSLYNKL